LVGGTRSADSHFQADESVVPHVTSPDELGVAVGARHFSRGSRYMRIYRGGSIGGCPGPLENRGYEARASRAATVGISSGSISASTPLGSPTTRSSALPSYPASAILGALACRKGGAAVGRLRCHVLDGGSLTVQGKSSPSRILDPPQSAP